MYVECYVPHIILSHVFPLSNNRPFQLEDQANPTFHKNIKHKNTSDSMFHSGFLAVSLFAQNYTELDQRLLRRSAEASCFNPTVTSTFGESATATNH